MGRVVERKFVLSEDEGQGSPKEQYFRGYITRCVQYPGGSYLWHIRYEDGDSEELPLDDLEVLLLNEK